MPCLAVERAACVLAGALAGVGTLELVRAWLRRRQRRGAVQAPPESTIRLMTRLAIQHGATNLSQGFPNEPPPRAMVLAAAGALLDGASLESAAAMAATLERSVQLPEPGTSRDMLNQYNFPFGTPTLRAAVAAYYAEFYPGLPADADDNLTVVLGATEGFAVCLRALCAPGDAVVFFQPFHELYPAQCTLWGLAPRAVTLHEREGGGWAFEPRELERAMRGARVLLFNSPHNPTGKVFTRAELQQIAECAQRHDVHVVTDEIYEHMVFHSGPIGGGGGGGGGGGRLGGGGGPPARPAHISLATLPGMAVRTCIVNAVSKTAKATGWRVGWVVAPAALTPTIRAVHDQLVLQAPTPLQIGAAVMLRRPRAEFDEISAEYLPKRDLLHAALRRAGFEVGPPPEGAYYIFAGYHGVAALAGLSPRDAAMKMTAEFKVACVPGDNFYLGARAKRHAELGGRYLRFTFVRSLDVLREAAGKLEALAACNP
jgi:aspartate/methionine/tyrosine aminotransferase